MEDLNNVRATSFRSVVLALSGAALLYGCEQPGPKCSVARGDFAASYTLVSGSGECAELKGEILSIQSYNAPSNGTGGRPDPDKVSIAIQPASISDLLGATRAEPNAEDRPFAIGRFDSAEPDADEFCVAPSLSVAQLRLPAVDEEVLMCTTEPAQDAVDIKYEWSNVRVYATASAYGTQLAADLVYTKDGCRATYRVTAVYPVVSCAVPLNPPSEEPEEPAEEPPADEEPLDPEACPPEEEVVDPGEMVPDDSLCAAVEDPASGSFVGTGINPDLAVACNPELMFCVLSKDPPAFRE